MKCYFYSVYSPSFISVCVLQQRRDAALDALYTPTMQLVCVRNMSAVADCRCRESQSRGFAVTAYRIGPVFIFVCRPRLGFNHRTWTSINFVLPSIPCNRTLVKANSDLIFAVTSVPLMGRYFHVNLSRFRLNTVPRT